MKINYIFKIAFIFIIGLFITSCSSNKKVEDNANNNVEMITIKDSIGEVQIPKEPKRVVDLSGNSDMLHILGLPIVGTSNSDAYDYTKFPSYLEDTLKGAKILGYSMQDTADIEGILELSPDLIIISKTQEKIYNSLKEIAPTVLIELEQIDWKKDFLKIASMFNKEEESKTWLSNYEKKAKENGDKINSSLGSDKTYLSILASGGQIFVFNSAGVGGILYDDMGLLRPEVLPAQDNISLPVVSYEGLSEINSDYIIIVGTDSDIKALKDHPVYESLSAVKEGNVIELPSSPYFNMVYSVIGRDLFLDDITSKIMEN